MSKDWNRGALGVLVFVTLAAGLCGRSSAAGVPGGNRDKVKTPVELGRVKWLRDFEAALRDGERERKPILVLFQEVPGCGTCVNYGKRVLSHPLVVEAAETLFVPVAVYNNIKGADARVLKSFGEKAWNNPVVRVIAWDRRELAPRLAEDYTVGGLAERMVRALSKSGRDVPAWFRLVADESAWRSGRVETATLGMHCFWEGEAALGVIAGVVGTVPGFVGEAEVVEVRYDPRMLSYGALLERARGMKCADTVYTRGAEQQAMAEIAGGRAVPLTDEVRPDKAPKYYLSQTALKFVPMSGIQAMRVNSALGSEKDGLEWLSPRQRKLLRVIEAHPKAGWAESIGAEDLIVSWEAAWAIASGLR